MDLGLLGGTMMVRFAIGLFFSVTALLVGRKPELRCFIPESPVLMVELSSFGHSPFPDKLSLRRATSAGPSGMGGRGLRGALLLGGLGKGRDGGAGRLGPIFGLIKNNKQFSIYHAIKKRQVP